MDTAEIPLFPLHTVLYPGGPLALRIFEPRYLHMISRCLRGQHGFGVLLIREGRDWGGEVQTFDVGTLADIADWYGLDDGLLGVTARGGRRFRLLEMRSEPDGLNVGRVQDWPAEPTLALPTEYAPLARLLEGLLDRMGPLYTDLPRSLEDAGWVGFRLAELLPLPLAEKQALLEMTDPEARLVHLKRRVREEGWKKN